MSMCVNAARQDEFAGGINDLYAKRHIEIHPNGSNKLELYCKINALEVACDKGVRGKIQVHTNSYWRYARYENSLTAPHSPHHLFKVL